MGVLISPPFNQTENNPEPTYKEFLVRAKAQIAKANPKVPRCRTECQGPNLPHLEAPTMELHLVIVSKVYSYC